MLRRRLLSACLLLLALPALAVEDPLTELWPTDTGLFFSYEYDYASAMFNRYAFGPAYLEFEGPTTVPGGDAWTLAGATPAIAPISGVPQPGLLRYLWAARPDLRAKIAARPTADRDQFWYPYFLHTGSFRNAGDRLEMWQDGWDHSTWTYVAAPVVGGMSFTHQLVPELTDDVFLHGVITDMNAVADTPAGIFTDCVKVSYLIDLGVSVATNEMGEVVATTHGEVAGYVIFAPRVGPVELFEAMTPLVWVDCGDEPCGEETLYWHVGEVGEVQTLLLSEMPVGNDDQTWSELKRMYR
ncbi:hypothetical protein KDK88_06925 [bacterium]|nr:hypothetical protein [bacterium]